MRRWGERFGGGRAAWLAALLLCSPPGPSIALAQSDASEEAGGTEGGAGSFSFGDTMSRVFLRAVEGPFGLGDPLSNEGELCGDPTSEEPIAEDVLAAFSARLEQSWKKYAGESEDTRTLMLEVCLGAEGQSLRRPYLVNPSGALQPEEAATLVKALDAVAEAAPLATPTPEEGPWRRILVLFDPLKGGERARGDGN